MQLAQFADLNVDVTSSITDLVIEGISSHSILLDSYVVLHAALISTLHKLIGVEFGRAIRSVPLSYAYGECSGIFRAKRRDKL